MITLALTRTVPCMALAAEMARRMTSADAAMASACGRRSSAVRVGSRPLCERVNSALPPSAFSSAATCLPTVGCVRRSSRAAAERLPLWSTARKVR